MESIGSWLTAGRVALNFNWPPLLTAYTNDKKQNKKTPRITSLLIKKQTCQGSYNLRSVSSLK